MTSHPAPVLSVVVPVYNEAAILAELAQRCAAAATASTARVEVLLVDDGSTDGTLQLAAHLSAPVRVLHLPRNVGQFAATQEGLRRARGSVVVVLDGDLQDPPEHIPRLVDRLLTSSTLQVVFAVKASRDDPAWFRLGRAAYGLATRLPGTRIVPPGAGAFAAMRAPVAAQVAAVTAPEANLAAVLVALGVRFDTVSYVKAARYDGSSRIGPVGLIREAWGSLVLTGAAGRLLSALGILAIASAAMAPSPWCWAMLLTAALSFVQALALQRRATAWLAGVERASPPSETP